MTSLNISNNGLTRGALKKYPGYSAAGGRWDDKWGEQDSDYETSMEGVMALADGIKNNGALTSLNISNNSLGGYYKADEDGDMVWISDMIGIKALATVIPECK